MEVFVFAVFALAALASAVGIDNWQAELHPGDKIARLESLKQEGRKILMVGDGLNKSELETNPVLAEYVIHDLNSDPRLPFPDNHFDAVVNTVSVDYLTQPLEVFREVSRVLKPDGLFIVVFSNRMFPPKAVNIWKRSTEKQRTELVRRFFTLSGRFAIEGYHESTGKPRPKDDKYYEPGIPSDPIYAVWGKPTRKSADSLH